jgi:diguanylate cyclase (GGDEF)-like protein/PAS domain S-box-containing protein
MSGYSISELIGMNVCQLEVNEGPEEVNAHIKKLMELGHDRFETQHRRKDGSVIDIEASATYLTESKEIFVFSHDITKRKLAEQALRIAAATFETQDGIIITDAHSNIIRVNRAFTEITGYAAEDVIGRNPRLLSSGRQDQAFYSEMWRQLLEQGSWAGEIWDKRKNGEIYPKWMTVTAVKNEQGEIQQYVALFSDITQRKKLEEQIQQLAFYDTLTNLPNRRLLSDRLNQTMHASKRSGYHAAVMFLDLDNFKPLNDKHGHVIGDLLLVEAANRLTSCVREIDTVARFGGDEFVVMISELCSDQDESTSQALAIAEKIRNTLSAPYLLQYRREGQPDICVQHYCTVSIGVAVFIDHQGSQEDILKWADEAMYQAKETGRNTIRFYERKV